MGIIFPSTIDYGGGFRPPSLQYTTVERPLSAAPRSRGWKTNTHNQSIPFLLFMRPLLGIGISCIVLSFRFRCILTTSSKHTWTHCRRFKCQFRAKLSCGRSLYIYCIYYRVCHINFIFTSCPFEMLLHIFQHIVVLDTCDLLNVFGDFRIPTCHIFTNLVVEVSGCRQAGQIEQIGKASTQPVVL